MTTTTDQVPQNLLVDFDVYDPSLATPVDVMQERVAELAAKGPAVFSPAYGGHWIVTHYKEIHQVLTDPETFSSYPNNLVTSDIGKGSTFTMRVPADNNELAHRKPRPAASAA